MKVRTVQWDDGKEAISYMSNYTTFEDEKGRWIVGEMEAILANDGKWDSVDVHDSEGTLRMTIPWHSVRFVTWFV